MALQAVWVPGCVAVPSAVGWRAGSDSSEGGLVKARFDQTISPDPGPAPTREIEWSEIVGHSGPGGAGYRGQTSRSVMFTFPIPTPCFRAPGDSLPPDPGRARLRRVFLLFSAQSGVSLRRLWVFDSQRQLFDQHLDIESGVNLPDDDITWSAPPARSNTWEIGDPEIRFGVSIAVLAHFGEHQEFNQIVFRTAGADFIV